MLFIWLKGKLAKNTEIKPVDVGILLIPFVLWMDSGCSRFRGIVERSRLTASLILDVTRELENKKQVQEN